MIEQASTGFSKSPNHRKLSLQEGGRLFRVSLILAIAISPLPAQESVLVQSPLPAGVTGTAGAIPEPAQRHSSDTVAYWYGPSYRTPFVVNPDTGAAADIQHAHARRQTCFGKKVAGVGCEYRALKAETIQFTRRVSQGIFDLGGCDSKFQIRHLSNLLLNCEKFYP